jgi:MtN3 and saliva related transmembrane protein
MVSTALGLAAVSWALVIVLLPILQVREIMRRDSSEGISVGYFAILTGWLRLVGSYGIASHGLPLFVPNNVAFPVMGCTIAIALQKR